MTILPYAAYFVWLLYKQRVALVMTGIQPGPAMMLASFGVTAALTSWLLLLQGRFRVLSALLLDLLITLILLADILYWRQFGDLVSIASLRFSGQLVTVGSSVTALIKPEDMRLFLDLPVIALSLFLPRHLFARAGRTGWKGVTLAAVAGIGIVALVAAIDPLLAAKYYGHSNVASRMGLLSYHLVDGGAYAARLALRAAPAASAVADVSAYFRDQPKASPSPLLGAAKGKNVIYIQVESLQAFTLGLTVNGQEVTPYLNRFARESLFFTDHYSQTGQGVTSDADLLGNCSLYPTRTGAVYYDYATNDFRCMPTLLRENGYRTVAMQGMPPDFWNLASIYPRIGFERYYSIKDFAFDEKIGIGLSDESFFRQALPKLKALPEPYYAFLVTLTSHGPFDFPGLPQSLKLGDLEGTVAGKYIQAVHYTDAAIGHFLEQLRAEGILDRSVVVLVGDHAGVSRKDSGMAELLQIPEEDEVNLTRMEKRVPLMIRLPEGRGAGEQPQIAGQVDIAPTLAGLLGVPTDSVTFMGRDLLSRRDGVVAFYTGSALTASRLFWLQNDEPDGRCYDRQSGQALPPDECRPMAGEAARNLAVGRMIIERNLIPLLD